jgi:hypothetical protein
MVDQLALGAVVTGEKVYVNTGGATVLRCESGNPALGMMCAPVREGLIVCLPTGPEPRHALDSVAVLLGWEQCAALAELAHEATERERAEG